MLKIILTKDEFLKKFKPKENPYKDNTLIDDPVFDDQYLFKNFGEDFEYIKNCNPNTIWSIINSSVILSGYYQQAIGYIITENYFIREYLVTI